MVNSLESSTGREKQRMCKNKEHQQVDQVKKVTGRSS